MKANKFENECFLDFLHEKENYNGKYSENFQMENMSLEIKKMIENLDDKNLPKNIRAKMVQKIRNRFSA